MCKPKIIAAGFMIALGLSLGAEAKLCKWVDDHGDMHYADVGSSSQASQGAGQGDQADAIGGCTENMSPEALRAKQDDAAKKMAAKKEMEDRKRRANALRATYSNEKEIDLAFERNAALVNARIAAYDVQLKSAQDSLDDLKKYVDRLSGEGKAIPASATDERTETEARIARLQAERAKSKDELNAMKARCEEDKMIYRKIILLPPPDDAETKVDNSYPVGEDGGYPTYGRGKRAKKARARVDYYQ